METISSLMYMKRDADTCDFLLKYQNKQPGAVESNGAN